MKRLITTSAAVLFVVATSAFAICPPGGGPNETSEDFSASGGYWGVAAITPGTVPGVVLGPDLLITEVSYTANGQEFVEIYNPTGVTVSLANYYLSDDAFVTGPVGYWQIVLGGAYVIGTTTDFNVKFPAGATIGAGATKVIFMGAAGVGTMPTAPIVADYEVASANASIPDMVPFGNTPSPANGLLTNGSTTNGESVTLYKWDGVCDLVCDVDYVGWGNITAPTASHRIDKTGISIDGVDGDAIASTYLADTAVASQSLGQTHTSGSSIQRLGTGPQGVNGNGCLVPIISVEEKTWGGTKALYR
jgi:hypothetical protein